MPCARYVPSVLIVSCRLEPSARYYWAKVTRVIIADMGLGGCYSSTPCYCTPVSVASFFLVQQTTLRSILRAYAYTHLHILTCSLSLPLVYPILRALTASQNADFAHCRHLLLGLSSGHQTWPSVWTSAWIHSLDFGSGSQTPPLCDRISCSRLTPRVLLTTTLCACSRRLLRWYVTAIRVRGITVGTKR